MHVRIDKEANLNEGNRNRCIAPGQQLATVNGNRGDTFNALCPLSRLLMVRKLTSEREDRHTIAMLSSIDQPAIKLNTRTRPRRLSAVCWWEHILKLYARRIVQVQRFQGMLICLELFAIRTIIQRELTTFKVQCSLQFT